MLRYNVVGLAKIARLGGISARRVRFNSQVAIPTNEVKKEDVEKVKEEDNTKKEDIKKEEDNGKEPVVMGKDGVLRYRVIHPSEPENSFQNDYHKYVNYTLVPLTLATFGSVMYTGVVHPLLDTTLSTLFLVSTHYHFTSCILDYIPKEKFKRLHKLAMYLLYSATGLGLFGIYEMETESNGFVDLVRRLWSEDDSQLFFRK